MAAKERAGELTVAEMRRQIRLRQPAGHLDEEPLRSVTLFEGFCRDLDAFWRELRTPCFSIVTLGGSNSTHVVQHHNVRSRFYRFLRLLLVSHFHIDPDGEPTHRLGRLDRLGDASFAPDMIVLEHHHRRQVVPVRVDPADEHAILFDEAEPGRGFPGTSNQTGVASIARKSEQTARSASNAVRLDR